MINRQLHKDPVPLDRDLHRAWRLKPGADALAAAAGLNAFFVNAVEFVDACREYPVVFVRAGDNTQTGRMDVAPVAVFGLSQGENLFVGDGARWQAEYVPALLRAYPFALANAGADDRQLVCIDRAWDGVLQDAQAQGEGTALFEADGQPSAHLKEVQQYLEKLQLEMQRTRAFCQRLLELELLQGTRFDATLPDGNKLTVDGFMVIDSNKFQALPDATVLELHKNGILGLVHMHHVSMGNMRRLVDRRARRTANA